MKYSELVRPGARSLDPVGKVSAESVRKHTGKDWRAWVTLLEKAGAASWTYREIVAFLKKKHRLTPWWQQGVAMGFEIAIGRRKPGQDAKGKYTVTATKSLSVDAPAVWKRLLSAGGIALWLEPLSPLRIAPKTPFETRDGYFGEIRTVTPGRKIRLRWQDPLWDKPTTVEVLVVAKPEKRSILAFNHSGIPDAKIRETLRVRWRRVADRLAKC